MNVKAGMTTAFAAGIVAAVAACTGGAGPEVARADAAGDSPPAVRTLTLDVSERGKPGPLPCRVRIYRPGAAHEPAYLDVCAGHVAVELPAGPYVARVERGPEYERIEQAVEMQAAEDRHLRVELRRLVDLRQLGWYSGETHVHDPTPRPVGKPAGGHPVDGALLTRHMLAENVNVAPVLTNWQPALPTAEVPDPAVVEVAADRVYSLYNWEDEPRYDSVNYFRIGKPFEVSESAEQMGIIDRLREVKRQQPGVVAVVDANNFERVPHLVATGEIDGMETLSHKFSWWLMSDQHGVDFTRGWGRQLATKDWRMHGLYHQDLYYRYLNCGFRIVPSGGTAFGFRSRVGLGFNRVYVHLGEDFSYERWWDGFLAGRSFVTNGPVLLAKANGKLPGEVFTSPADSPFEARLEVAVVSNRPLESIEVIRDGKVAERIEVDGTAATVEPRPLAFDRSGWFLVRTITTATNNFIAAHTAPFHVEIGGTASTIHREDVQFLLDWVGEEDLGGARKTYEALLQQAR